MAEYHDREWGRAVRDDKKIFEFLVLESAQAGLSWLTVLRKREGYRKAFANFDAGRVARFGAREEARLLANPAIIRNGAKVRAAINNARAFLAVQKEFGSFSRYMWQWVGNKPLKHEIAALKDYPTRTPEAEAWAHDLKKRGFKFLGPTTLYAHMQAVGMARDHMRHCFLYK